MNRPRLGATCVIFGCLVSTALAGCYSVTGQTREITTIRESVVDSRLEIGAPEGPGTVELDARIEEGVLVLRAETIAQCREETLETVRTTELTTRELPASHWVVFGTGAAFLVGGVSMLAIGLDGVAAGEGRDIGTADQETAYDEGLILTGVGAGATAVGGLVLTSELVDMVLAVDSESAPRERERRIAGGLAACDAGPADSLNVEILANAGRAVILLDASGERRLALDAQPLLSLTGGIRATLRVSCDGCEARVVAVPPVAP